MTEQLPAKRYVLCGLSARALHHFVLPLAGRSKYGEPDNYNAYGSLEAIVDVDEQRVRKFFEREGWQTRYGKPEDLDAILRETQADALLVTGPDHTHCEHILAG